MGTAREVLDIQQYKHSELSAASLVPVKQTHYTVFLPNVSVPAGIHKDISASPSCHPVWPVSLYLTPTINHLPW